MSSHDRRDNIRLFTVLMGLGLFLVGCAPTLESRYAEPRGESINGVSSFVELLKHSGRKVDVWPAISPRMQFNYETLIVFESKFDAMPQKLCRDLESLMRYGSLSTLVIVARDSNAAVDYWRQMKDRTDSTQSDRDAADKWYRAESASFLADASPEFDAEKGTFFGLKRVDRSNDSLVRTIESGWEGDPVQARWPLNRRLEPRSAAEVIWKSGDDPLLTYDDQDDYEILVLGSATPILNGGLVDPGNRQLAAEFVNHIPQTGRVAVALSTRWFDDSETESPGILRFLQVHPNGWVFGQGIAALLLFCWCRFPIFGRPRESIITETARFGRHVDALGNLLRRTGDTNYARKRIRDWFGLPDSPSDSDSKSN